MKIGIIREGKIPPDSRVPLTPEQGKYVTENTNFNIVVQSSPDRCYSDDEYANLDLPVVDDVSDCDILMGVKEVPIAQLIPNKTYFFFSHTMKEQPYNQDLLRAILDKKITLVDYEALTDKNGQRLIAFGRFAGMVGAHNGIMTYGSRTGTFSLPRMKHFQNYSEAREFYKSVRFPSIKVVLTGTGRVGQGAAAVLSDMGFTKVRPAEYLSESYDSPVFCQLTPNHYVRHKYNKKFKKDEFYAFPKEFVSAFRPYTLVSDVMINGIYWDNDAPAFFTKNEMTDVNFNIQVIADITCDIAPVASIPSTLRASTIDEPVFGYDPVNQVEVDAYRPDAIDMMTIDNLPNELPRDASNAFGEQFINHILPEFKKAGSSVLERATVTRHGRLGPHFQYLSDYAGLKKTND